MISADTARSDLLWLPSSRNETRPSGRDKDAEITQGRTIKLIWDARSFSRPDISQQGICLCFNALCSYNETNQFGTELSRNRCNASFAGLPKAQRVWVYDSHLRGTGETAAPTHFRTSETGHTRSYECSFQFTVHDDAASGGKHHCIQHWLAHRRSAAAQSGTFRVHGLSHVYALPVSGSTSAAAAATSSGSSPERAPRDPSAPPDPGLTQRVLLESGAGHGAHVHANGHVTRRLLHLAVSAPGRGEEARLSVSSRHVW